MGQASFKNLDSALGNTVNTATSAAKITSSAINTRNQVFYNHTYSLYLPRRTGQFFVFVAIVIAVIVAVFAAQYKPKKNEENDDSSTFTRDKGWWITVGVFTVLGGLLIAYTSIYLTILTPKATAVETTAEVVTGFL